MTKIFQRMKKILILATISFMAVEAVVPASALARSWDHHVPRYDYDRPPSRPYYHHHRHHRDDDAAVVALSVLTGAMVLPALMADRYPEPQRVVYVPVQQPQPTTYFYDAPLPCREYTSTSWIGNHQEIVYGRACLQPDGSWRTVN